MHPPFELAVPVGPADHVIGAAHAKVTVVEYGDYECPNCKQAAPAVKLLLKDFADNLRFVYRHFPLEAVHPHALNAAEAAECAAAQGKFWQMHDLLFENQHALKGHHLREYAERLELDMVKFNAEMNDHIYLQRIREHIRSGEESGVRATPAFFVNGKIIDTSFNIRVLFDAVRAVVKK